MRVNFCIFDEIGKILLTGSNEITNLPTANVLIMEDNFPEISILTNTCYVKDGIITERPTQTTTTDKLTLIADGIDTITISNAPSGIFTAVNTATHETVSGAINGTDTFATTIQGTYTIRIESFPYLDFTATIEAI